MMPLSLSYLSLDTADVSPSERELAARLRVPKRELPDLRDEIAYLTAVAAPAAVVAFCERDPEITALLSLDASPSLCQSHLGLFAVTLGYGVDRLLEREKRCGISRAYLLDAVASAMAEAAADAADAALRALYPDCTFGRRFSPGYGRIGLSAQAPLLSLLEAGVRLGIRQSESSLMHPTKTITAILGGTHENRSCT